MSIVKITRGAGNIVAAAIHDGHNVRMRLKRRMLLGDAERLREEDPYTALWAKVAPTRIVGQHSRFEFDLNRQREQAVYQHPADAWGLNVWKSPLTDSEVERSLASYDEFYEKAKSVFDPLAAAGTPFVVLDLHSYNHRRDGPDKEPANPELNPEVNLGTAWIDREFWAPVIDRFIADLQSHPVMGHPLDVRENVKFKGGWFSRWLEAHYPRRACPIAVEFKKTFMDEWSGRLNPEAHHEIGIALGGTIAGLEDSLSGIPRIAP